MEEREIILKDKKIVCIFIFDTLVSFFPPTSSVKLNRQK